MTTQFSWPRKYILKNETFYYKFGFKNKTINFSQNDSRSLSQILIQAGIKSQKQKLKIAKKLLRDFSRFASKHPYDAFKVCPNCFYANNEISASIHKALSQVNMQSEDLYQVLLKSTARVENKEESEIFAAL